MLLRPTQRVLIVLKLRYLFIIVDISDNQKFESFISNEFLLMIFHQEDSLIKSFADGSIFFEQGAIKLGREVDLSLVGDFLVLTDADHMLGASLMEKARRFL